jgi:two-component system, sensor histidine kinase and response regulator
MMRRSLSLNGRIVGLVALTNATTLGLLAALFVLLEYSAARQALAQEFQSVTETIGINAAAALSFEDRQTARESLDSLKRDPRVLGAAIYKMTPEGEASEVFASFGSGIPSVDSGRQLSPGATFGPGWAILADDIEWHGNRLGRIAVRVSLDQVRERLTDYGAISLLALALSLGIGILVSRRLSLLVTNPVAKLAEAARRVTRHADFNVRLSPLNHDEVGELTECFNGMLTTIRERDRLLHDHKENLEEKVRLRTQELELARQKAVESARLKSEFLANMSHEIRTPLNGVMGMTALAMDTELSGEARDYLETAMSSAGTLLAVINDILDFSKIDAGKLGLEAIPFEVHATLNSMSKTFALAAHRKRIELVCDLDPTIPPVLLGDPTRLQQVLGNLISNAIKFTDAGEVVLKVRLVRSESGSALVRFSVSDTGIGIPTEHQERIFESFTQADGSTTRRFGGTGLGLSIANKLVQLMGGSIRISSEPGKGSDFSFELNLPQAEDKTAGSAGRDVPARPEILAGLRVLIVDDHATNRRVLSGYARRLGMVPVAVDGASEALELCLSRQRSGEPFDLVFTDYRLHGTDGLALAGALLSQEPLAATPLVLVTSVDQSGLVTKARNASIRCCLTKPVTSEEFCEAALTALHHQNQQQESGETESAPGAGKPNTAGRIGSSYHGRCMHILVAEDNAVNQRVVVRLLEQLGHRPVVVANGRLAVSAIEQPGERFDLILMDCQMPQMDGFEATRRIRLYEARVGRRTPIIALTAHALKGDKERCLDAGMDDYLPKPIDRADLATKLTLIAHEPAAGDPEPVSTAG